MILYGHVRKQFCFRLHFLEQNVKYSNLDLSASAVSVLIPILLWNVLDETKQQLQLREQNYLITVIGLRYITSVAWDLGGQLTCVCYVLC